MSKVENSVVHKIGSNGACKAMVLLLLTFCLLLLPLWESVMSYVLLCVTLCPLQHCNHLEWEERAGCFA